MKNRSGTYITQLSGEQAYQSFLPTPLPPQPPLVVDAEIAHLLILAHTWISKLEAISSYIPHVAVFVSMYVRKEALMSAQIEGTQCTLEDVLDPINEANTNRDVLDVVNYIKAVDFALNKLKELPLCNRLIRETHEVLMKDSRGNEKSPGNFRTTQNWIGGLLKNARFIPPHPADMVEAMSDLERYMNESSSLDVLIRCALIHYQFETIHPFLDGNGRIGRLLVTLYLLDQNVLSTPALYTSYFLKNNRLEYYDRLMEVRTKGRYEQWVSFFLRAVVESVQDAYEKIIALTELHDKHTALIQSLGRSRFTALQLYAYLLAHPIIEVGPTARALGLSFNTVSNTVQRLIALGILTKQDGGRRNQRYIYKEYFHILREGT